jgi:hypothetical protein
MWLSMRGRVKSGASLGVFDRNRPFWLILQCPKDIMWFYINQINQAVVDGLEKKVVGPPLADCHVSIVRDEKARSDPWKAAQGYPLRFEYQPCLQTNGKHWWLPVRSREVENLRERIGLRPRGYVPLHLTVACTSVLEEKTQRRATKEVIVRKAQLELMREKMPNELWPSCPEAQELKTLEERFYV